MKTVKTNMRSSLTSDTLSDLLMVKLHAADITSFDPLPAMQLWRTHSLDAPKKRRRPDYIKGRKPPTKRTASDTAAGSAAGSTAGEPCVVDSDSDSDHDYDCSDHDCDMDEEMFVKDRDSDIDGNDSDDDSSFHLYLSDSDTTVD